MEYTKREQRKFAWLPTKVRIFNDDSSRFVVTWFSHYYRSQLFQKTTDNERTHVWEWVTISKYLEQKN